MEFFLFKKESVRRLGERQVQEVFCGAAAPPGVIKCGVQGHRAALLGAQLPRPRLPPMHGHYGHLTR